MARRARDRYCGAYGLYLQVVRTQCLAVNAVTGATYSSKVILLAMRNALAGAAR